MLTACVCACVCMRETEIAVLLTVRHTGVKRRANINGEDYPQITIISGVTRCDRVGAGHQTNGALVSKVFPAGRLNVAPRGPHSHSASVQHLSFPPSCLERKATFPLLFVQESVLLGFRSDCWGLFVSKVHLSDTKNSTAAL